LFIVAEFTVITHVAASGATSSAATLPSLAAAVRLAALVFPGVGVAVAADGVPLADVLALGLGVGVGLGASEGLGVADGLPAVGDGAGDDAVGVGDGDELGADVDGLGDGEGEGPTQIMPRMQPAADRGAATADCLAPVTLTTPTATTVGSTASAMSRRITTWSPPRWSRRRQ
jgi:hypothetical protein